MGSPPTTHDLAVKLAQLEERMETHQAKYETGLERLERKIAERDADQASRDKDNLRWQIGLWIAAIVILGVLIRWPG